MCLEGPSAKPNNRDQRSQDGVVWLVPSSEWIMGTLTSSMDRTPLEVLGHGSSGFNTSRFHSPADQHLRREVPFEVAEFQTEVGQYTPQETAQTTL